MEAKEAEMGCWHGYGHGCGPGYYRLAPRGHCGPVDEYELYGWYEDVNWPLRRRYGERASEPRSRETALEMQLEELREEMRRIEAVLAGIQRPSSGSTAE
jgi:hypothetical protein